MKHRNIFFGLTLLTITCCSKDNETIIQTPDWCGTIADMTWTQTVSADSLTGNWIIWQISYSTGTGPTHTFDTTYNLATPLTLNSNGTGTIYSAPLSWALTTSPGTLPTLTITQLDTLFPFTVNFIYNNTADIYLQSPPPTQLQSRFFVTAGQGGNGQWEQAYISFERQ